MAKEKYVPVTGDDWYERRRQDAQGEFFRKVADQGPRKGQGGSTRQGIYMLTADGKLLAYKNAGQNPDVMREVLKQGLAEWARLPEERRKPGAVKVDDLERIDKRYDRAPPLGGLIVSVYTRILDKNGKGEWCKGSCASPGGDAAARDHLWLTKSEWLELVPADPKSGDKLPLPAAIAERMIRFHLIDNTRGEPPMWRKEEVRTSKLTLTVQEVTDAAVKLRLDGNVLVSTDLDLTKAARGFDARVTGFLSYDRQQKAMNKLEIVAFGDHWGEATFTRNARDGRKPLGVVFELSRSDSAADRVPPQGIRDIDLYYGTGR